MLTAICALVGYVGGALWARDRAAVADYRLWVALGGNTRIVSLAPPTIAELREGVLSA